MWIAYEALHGGNGHEAGLALLARLYQQRTGQNLPAIARTQRGKPYFVDSPLHFSISHTKKHVFCALSETPIGIDAEELDRQVNPKLAAKILAPGELRQYEDALDKNKALLTFWVLKEAAAKLSGEGLQGFPNHTDFHLDDPRVTQLDGCLLAVMTEEKE